MDRFRLVLLFPLNPIIPEMYTRHPVFLALNFLEEHTQEMKKFPWRTYLSREVYNGVTNLRQLINQPQKLFSLSMEEARDELAKFECSPICSSIVGVSTAQRSIESTSAQHATDKSERNHV